jgi:hypothetical protein
MSDAPLHGAESEHDRCESVSGFGEDIRCALPKGHDYPHKAEDGHMTWEPIYVANLRREVENGPRRWRLLLADVLDDIGTELHSEAIDEAWRELRKWEAEHDG